MSLLDEKRFNQLNNCRVLLVGQGDNFNLYLTLMAHFLSAKECVVAKNTQMAAHLLNRKHYDIVLVDEDSTPLSASAFTRRVRLSTRHPNFRTPIIIMSQRQNQDVFDDVTTKSYAQNLLIKPFQLKDLNNTIEICRQSSIRGLVVSIPPECY